MSESLLGYHPCGTGFLTNLRDPEVGQCQVGSLTGAVASERVSEALKGSLRMVGNHSKSAKADSKRAQAEGSVTDRPTGRAGTKVGLSDQVVESGIAIAQRLKATLGITGLSLPRVHIDGVVWHLDVEVGPKGWAVRPLKRYASWVQNVVRQFGPYPARA